jgi:hypothetical protein
MLFSQLHYTSCKDGLASYDGFQFCAMTPGLATEVMREVEKLTVYELPLGWADVGDRGDADYPVNLLYTFSDALDLVVIARVEYAGRDFSNRPGNYFAHSLVTRERAGDPGAPLPIELWDAPFWQSSRGVDTELPPLAAPLSKGPITPRVIADFIAAVPGRTEFAKALLTAADLALHTDRKVLIIGADTGVICHWIAAACYLLGPHGGPRLTFATYGNDLRHVRTCVVGALPATVGRGVPSDITASFWVFDLRRDELPGLALNPAAVLLANHGIAASGELWNLAVRLGADPGETLSELFPLLASTALILGGSLTAAELDAAVEWLSCASGDLVTELLPTAVSAASRASPADLPAHRQEQLVELARRAESGSSRSSEPDESLTSRVECALAEGTLRRLDKGQPPGAGFRLHSARARNIAAVGTRHRLPSASAATAIRMLRWAHDAGGYPGDEAVREAGHAMIRQWPFDDQDMPDMIGLAGEWPEFRAGLTKGLAGLPPVAQATFLASRAATAFQLGDFTAFPALGEDWLVSAVHSSRMSHSSALDDIVRLRLGTGASSPVLDEQVIRRVWRNTAWTPAEGTDLITRLPAGELAAGSVASRLVSLLRDPPGHWRRLRAWTDFAAAVARTAENILPEADVPLAAELADAGQRLWSAYESRKPPDQAVLYLMRRYRDGSDELRLLLDRCLPPLMLDSHDLAEVLYQCPEGLFGLFCRYARHVIDDDVCSLHTIGMLFLMVRELRLRKKPNVERSRELEDQVIRPTLSTWSRRDIKELGRAMNDIVVNSSNWLDLWYKKNAKRRRIPWRRTQTLTSRHGGEPWVTSSWQSLPCSLPL